MDTATLKPGAAVTWQGEPWRVLGSVEAVGGGRAVQLEALTRDAFATTAEGSVTPAPEVDVAAVLAEREKRLAPARAGRELGVMRKALRKAEAVKNTARADWLKGQLAKREGRTA